jgi:hypothetical protein
MPPPKNPPWLYEGLVVYVDPRLAGVYDRKPGTGLRCVVTAAHGDHGRVENEAYHFSRLLSRWQMWLPLEKTDE